MDNLTGLKRKALSGSILILVLIAFDQWTKSLAAAHLKGHAAVSLIRNVLELLYVENTGAAFGIMNGMRLIFVVLAPLVSAALVYICLKLPGAPRFRWLRLCAVLIISGAMGNWIDRVRQGYVVDFIYFKPIDFPVFNVADIYVTCAAFGMIFLLLFYYTEEEANEIPLLGQKKNKQSDQDDNH